jgi:hypothetical protein
MKFMWNNIKTNFGSKGGIENIIVVATLALARDQDKGVASVRAYK